MTQNTAYRSNPNLKKAGIEIPFTQDQVEEFLKCANDPVYFAENYIKIISLDKGLVPFEMYDFQKDMIQCFHDNRYNIVKCPRRVGKSTVSIAFVLWLSIFKEQQNIVILANKEKLAQKLLYMYQLAFQNLPIWMQQGVKEWNKTSVELENGSIVQSAPTSSSGVRGEGFNLVLLDEFAFVPNSIAENFYTSVYPVITSGQTTKIIITSCVTRDTYVFTPQGIKQVNDYINHGFRPNPELGYNIDKYSIYGMDGLRSGEYFVNSGKSKTKIITSSSSKLECSLEHKLWASKNGNYDWYKAKDLEIGDYISIKYGENIWGNDDFISSPELAYILGLYFMHGNEIKNLNWTGFDPNNTSNISIPKPLFSCPKEIICSFLSGLFDSNGKITKKGISISFKSSELISQIRILLLNIGILTKYSTGKYHKLEINNGVMCEVYYNEIGSNLTENLDKITTLIKQQNKPYNETLKWEKIKSIVDSENEVYDFSLDHIDDDPWCHSVLYNGIVGHQTPNGMNLFYRLWTDANAKRNDYTPFSIHWSMVPGRDEKFKEDTIKNTSVRQWAQEFESISSDSFVSINTNDGENVNYTIKELYDELQERATQSEEN